MCSQFLFYFIFFEGYKETKEMNVIYIIVVGVFFGGTSSIRNL
jgi:hypothetical protein